MEIRRVGIRGGFGKAGLMCKDLGLIHLIVPASTSTLNPDKVINLLSQGPLYSSGMI